MNLLVKNATIIDPLSTHHKKEVDIYIKNGIIHKIDNNLKIKDNKLKIFTSDNLHLSPGWFDFHTNFGEPGYEHKETISNGSKVAISSGFSGLMLMPNTLPKLDNKTAIEYINNCAKDNAIDLYTCGNLTKNAEGSEIVEMHEMTKVGCKAFSDDKKSTLDTNLLKIALQYSSDCNALVINFPNENSLSKQGHMNEGKTSTELGMRGIPSVSEEIIVDRDINISSYLNIPLHLSYISTEKSVKKINQAKRKFVKISCDVTIHNLLLTDEKVKSFDSSYKVLPPLRSNADNKSLINGLKNDTIDIICTDHTPQDEVDKMVEFENAAYGIIGLESAFGLLCKHIVPKIGLSKLIEKIAINPRRILGINDVTIKEGEKANMTLFDPKIKWKFSRKDVLSKSKNTPFIDEELQGKALAVINNNKLVNCK